MCFWYCDCFRNLWAVIVSCLSSHLNLKKVDHGDNYLFHKNQIISRPKGDFIDNIHEFWFGDMERLERNHGYIQWLFPIMEQGVNAESTPLTKSEITEMINDEEVIGRIVKSFKMMLDFYGMVISDGYIERAGHYKCAYRNLIDHPHNFLRITRILKCLTIFKLDGYCSMWLKFLLYEVYVTEELNACRNSFERFWLFACSESVQLEVQNSFTREE